MIKNRLIFNEKSTYYFLDRTKSRQIHGPRGFQLRQGSVTKQSICFIDYVTNWYYKIGKIRKFDEKIIADFRRAHFQINIKYIRYTCMYVFHKIYVCFLWIIYMFSISSHQLPVTIWNKEFQQWKTGIDVLTHLVENFFLVILKRRIFFVFEIFSEKNWF